MYVCVSMYKDLTLLKDNVGLHYPKCSVLFRLVEHYAWYQDHQLCSCVLVLVVIHEHIAVHTLS